jgi:CRP-like cAMP-binding protein
MPPVTKQGARANRLLAALPKEEYQRLLPELRPVTLAFGKILYEPGAIIRHVYFPNDSIVSLISEVAERSTLEVAIVGNEGMTGISVFMGVARSRTRALVQCGGSAMRMKSAYLGRESDRSGALTRLLRRYTHSLFTQISQSAACNRFHKVDARLARWMLMTHDRTGSDEFRLTQEFMSNMLGVRRERVNMAAGDLQREKLISYSRGMIKIRDRAGLETVACECYRIIKEETDSFLY